MRVVEFIQASPANYTKGRGGNSVDGMAVHYTGTSASAHNNLVYFSRGGANASAHLFVDKNGSIYQSVSFDDTAWAVGNFKQNQRTISVEVVSAGEDFTDAQIAALADIYQHLRSRYGISRLIRHYDVTGKLCPAPYVSESKWQALKARIMGGSASSATTVPASLALDGQWGYYTSLATQEWLKAEGYYTGYLDGDWGYYSTLAMQKYLKAIGYYKNCYLDGAWGYYTSLATQQWLKKLGYYTGLLDGEWGSYSTLAMQKFLRAKGFYN